MTYLFEGKRSSKLAKFFCEAYEDSVSNKFIYTGGVRELYLMFKDLVEHHKIDEACIFIDIGLLNINTVVYYRKIANVIEDNRVKAIVIPIICAEYYAILSNIEFAVDIEAVNVVINCNEYKNTSYYLNSSKQRNMSTFEKFSKFVLANCFKCCFNKKQIEDTTLGRYFEEDCDCEDCDIRYSLCLKATNMLAKYPCVPYHVKSMSRFVSLSLDELYELHIGLVDRINSIVEQKYNTFTVLYNKKKEIDDYKIFVIDKTW